MKIYDAIVIGGGRRVLLQGIIGKKADGTREPVDTVIFATGYRPQLTYLQSTGALDSEERPVTGLYYVGLEGQR